MQYTVRNMRKSDLNEVRRVLLAANYFKKQKTRLINLNMYCDYYVEFACDTSFVAVDQNDNVFGYVMCAPYYKEYEKNYRKNYLKDLYKLSLFRGISKHCFLRIERKIAGKYDAHLHIDIDPIGQRQGVGHKLMDALCNKLHQINSPYVYLIVGENNDTGINFYNKYGFEVVKKLPGSIQYVLDVEKKFLSINKN